MDVEEIEFDIPDTKAKPTSTKNNLQWSKPPTRQTKPKPVAARVQSKTSDTKATATFSKLLIIITLMIASGRIKRAGIADPGGTLAEDLAMTDEEATEVARPIARFGNSTPMGSRLIKPVVDNEDIIGALFALYEYNRRTNDILSRVNGGQVPSNISRMERTKSNVNPAKDETSGPVSGEPIYAPGNPWDAEIA